MCCAPVGLPVGCFSYKALLLGDYLGPETLDFGRGGSQLGLQIFIVEHGIDNS
jgi:hypothetical protein